MSKILIIEDDEKLRKELEIFLNKNGYEATSLENFENPVKDAIEINSDLILLDINLPNIDGEYILREIRKVSNVPIIMITSKDNELDELISLNYGADQYVTKPFNLQILLAKIAGLLRRSKITDTNQNKIDCQDFILNVSKSMLERGNTQIELTKNELKILYFLVSKRGQIVSREEIINYLWESESFIDDNTLTVNMKRLRTKLEEVGLQDIIETKRGQGYILN
mgnify:FL=1